MAPAVNVPAALLTSYLVITSLTTVRPLLQGAARIARHLWRMSFALFIAALSFFIGQAKVFPEPVRIPLLLGMPVIAVLVTMLYWLWRVSLRRRLRGLSIASTRQS